MDEVREQCGAQIAELFQPIDFSNIPGFPNFGHDVGDVYKWLPVFHGNYGDHPSSMSNLSFSLWLTPMCFMKTI